jgi:hypothetical protein
VVAVAILASCGGDDSSADDPPDTSTTLVGSATTNPPAPTVPTSTEPPAPGPTQPVPSAPPDLAFGGYQIASDAAPPLLVGGKSDPVVSPLSDGVYWSWEYESDGDTIDFVLTQLFTGDACREQFGDDDAACASDNNTLYEPSATVTMPAEAVSVTVLDQDGQGGFDRYGVSPVEFVRLVADLAPASDAPAGFEFERHPVVVTIDDGEVVAVDHVFMS